MYYFHISQQIVRQLDQGSTAVRLVHGTVFHEKVYIAAYFIHVLVEIFRPAANVCRFQTSIHRLVE